MAALDDLYGHGFFTPHVGDGTVVVVGVVVVFGALKVSKTKQCTCSRTEVSHLGVSMAAWIAARH